jgi:hypothetical protein
MRRHLSLALALAGMLGISLKNIGAGESAVIESKIGGRHVKMMLTGSAVRTKSIFKVYSIDSYIEQGLKVRTAEDIVAIDGPKQLHILMLRNVSGPDMAEAFITTVRANHAEPEFDAEVTLVAKILRGQTAHKGDEIWFTHIPKVGFQCRAPGGVVHLIRNVEFSKAVWENYFGKHNVGDNVKQALLSRLTKE